MTDNQNPAAGEPLAATGEEGGPFFFVNNTRKGHVEPQGEDLTGSQILERVGLSTDRYDLFPVEHGHAGDQIQPTAVVHVKPGDHFRATLKGTDYSSESPV